MTLDDKFARSAALEFGFPNRRARVDPAKTLGLISRIQKASDPPKVGKLQPTPTLKPIARAG